MDRKAMDNNPIENLLQELSEFKARVIELEKENYRLQESFIQQMSPQNDVNLELHNQVLLLQMENSKLREEISSLQGSALTSHEMPRKVPKKSAASPMGATDEFPVLSPINNSNPVNSISSSDHQPVGVIKKKKIIQIIDAELSAIKGHIKSTNCKDFSLKQSGIKAPIKVTINQPNDIPTVRSALQKASVSFHEFKWDSEKEKCFIIRGLVGITENDLPHVRNELIEAGVPAEAKLSLYVTGYMKSNPGIPHNPLIKLVVPPNFDCQLLKTIRFIDHVVVKFEAFKSKAIVQCVNCQRFGHTASGCQHKHRCVKCGLNHLRDECPRTLNKAVKLSCCNCGGEHTANNVTNCPYFLNKVAKKQQPSSTQGLNPVAGRSKDGCRVVNQCTYADAAKKQSTSNNNNASQEPHNYSELVRKIDMLCALVSKHDNIIQQLCSHG